MNITKDKIVAFTIAILISVSFLWATVLSGPSAFNLIPFEIHEAINPGGASEDIFIKVFEIITSILIFTISYRVIRNRI